MTDPSGSRSDDIVFDPDETRRRYREERERRQRADGPDQFIRLGDGSTRFAGFEIDPFAEGDAARDPVEREVDVVLVGAGFGGIQTAIRLRELGIDDFLMIDNGGDFGGTWYWNRYPGIACDVESWLYMPRLEELGKVPTMRYASGTEIFRHCQDLGRHYDLYARALFRTRVTAMRWDEAAHRWRIATDRGDAIAARFVAMSTGPLNQPKLPGVPGIEDFAGHAFHTSRWDYGYTGGDASGGLTGLVDKRVGIIGTGATAIQSVPHLARWAKQLFVFQRTPSTIQPRENRPTDPAWAASLQPGWQAERIENFTACVSGLHDLDLTSDGWTRTFRLLFDPGDVPPDRIAEALELNDLRKMAEIRQHIAQIVEDPQTAEALKPWYNLMCKRLGFSDEYLQAYNRSNVTLVDTRGKGVERIDAGGVVANGTHYDLDCLIFATGFEWLTEHRIGCGFEITGRGGLRQSESWKDGVLSLYGIHSRDFPNRFVLGNSQQPQTVNFTHTLDIVAHYVAGLIRHCLDRGIETVEPSAQAQDEWVDRVERAGRERHGFYENCTPGYYNNHGEYSLRTARNTGFAGSIRDFAVMLRQQRESGTYPGLEMR